MIDSPAAQTLLDTGDAIVELTADITDVSARGLGVWDIGGLAGHLLRAFRTPITYLEIEPSATVAVEDAAAYFAGYLERRDEDASGTDTAVAVRGSEELAGLSASEIVSTYRRTLTTLRTTLRAVDPGFVVNGPLGGIRLDAYLETRVFEATVHGLDLAAALGSTTWKPPDAGLQMSLRLLVDLAVRRGRGNELLLALTGRTHGSLRPLLQ